MFIGTPITTLNSLGPLLGGSSTPAFTDFEYDINTHYFDNVDLSKIQVSEIPGAEQVATNITATLGGKTMSNDTLDYCPLVTPNGFNFNKDTERQLRMDDVSGITNATDGYYFACNAQINTSDCTLWSMYRPAGSHASRGRISITGSRNFALRFGDNDGVENWVAFTRNTNITYGQWHTFEVLFDVANKIARFWIDGVEETNLQFDAADTRVIQPTLPNSDPNTVTMGNSPGTNATKSSDGGIQKIIFQNSVPTEQMRLSQSNYLNTERPS